MRTVFHAALIDEPTGDPGVWVDLLDEGRSVLLDLGDLRRVAVRKLLRVDLVVVSHMHMDHFVGFDQLLRIVLGRERPLRLVGPAGFVEAVRGRIAAYTWNLIREYPIRLAAYEVDGEVLRGASWSGEGGMEPTPLEPEPFRGVMHAERLFTVHADLLDHGIPVLGTAIRETEHLSINKDRLLRMGLAPGAWLRDLKHAVRRCEDLDRTIEASREDGTATAFSMREAAEALLLRAPGQVVAYLTDFGFTPDNVDRAARLARGADLLICEAAFLHEDVALAASRAHLTARQAGEIARAAGAARLAPFHFSPRYAGREEAIYREAAEAFGGPVLRLPVETGWGQRRVPAPAADR